MIEPVIKLIDLTQTLHPDIPDWHGFCGFQLHQDIDYKDIGIRVQSITTPLGIGTYMDAPSHFFEGAPDIANIALETLRVESVVINVAQKISSGYVITVQDIKDFEVAPRNKELFKSIPLDGNIHVFGLIIACQWNIRRMNDE